MNRIKTAVLLTVFNRKNVTLQGLRSLYKAITFLGDGYSFDIYMTDDGCTDGTAEAVAKEFPDIHIVKGDGNLYWSGGMRKAWQASIDSGIKYDYYLWFNDDSELYDDALKTMFGSYYMCGSKCIITGAFHDNEGNPSYGGKLIEKHPLVPDSSCIEVNLMNGNLVLISYYIYSRLGIIDGVYKHSFGDYDYGLRAQKKNIKVRLTTKYVGACDRHDDKLPPFFSSQLSLVKRLRILYNPRNNPIYNTIFVKRQKGYFGAIRFFLAINMYAIFPLLVKKH